MKILHVESGKHYYGGPLQVVFLIEGLRGMGHENVLVCPRGSAIAQAARGLCEVHEVEMRGDLDLGLVGRLRRVMRKASPDVVHLHSRRGSDIWGGMAARLEKVPVVLSRRVDNPEPRWIVNLKYRLYDQVIAISDAIRQVLMHEGLPASKITCVHDAVDVEQYRPGCRDSAWFRREFGLAEDELTIAMVAQFIPRKGHRTLIAALPAVLEAEPRTKVLLFGRGPEEPSIRQQVQSLGLAGRVVFAGFRNDLDQVMPCIDLLAHPASMEGLGVALLQAAACGIPIVAGRAGGIPEIVRHELTGELVEPQDSDALARSLIRLLQDAELRQRYGLAGRRLVLSQFSNPVMVAGNAAAYQAALARRVPTTQVS